MKCVTGIGSFFFLLKIIHCVLEGYNVNPDSDNYLESVLRYDKKVVETG